MRLLGTRSTLHSLVVVAVVGAFAATLTGCPDKAAPDPAAGKDGGTTAAAAASHPGASASAAASAKTGGW